ncbi:MAG: rhodanese-related (seleno)protein [Syntrophorhabdales bacterium]|jgi:rhodanese-related sulfurtransferase
MEKFFMVLVATAFLVVAGVHDVPAASTDAVPRMTEKELVPLIGKPNVVIIDARTPYEWKESPIKIKGAIRLEPKGNLKTLLETTPKESTIVLYCDCPHEATSASFAQMFQQNGFTKAYALSGGPDSGAWSAWTRQGFQTEKK